MGDRPDWPLERYRPLLRLQVRKMQLDQRLRLRLDLSGLVQDAMMKAWQEWEGFKGGETEAIRIAWLQNILKNVVIDKIREQTADKRDYHLERQLQQSIAWTTVQLMTKFVADPITGPEEQAMRHEKIAALTEALEKLLPDQRDVIIQHYFLELKVNEIAACRPGGTHKSVAGLLRRGLVKLREYLGGHE